MRVREVFECADLHAAGEPLRIIQSGYPALPRGSVLDRRAYLQQNLDHYRRWLMFEPWGHEDMYGCLLVEPEREDSVAGLIFMHNEGYSTMCGHATIAVATYLVETGRVAGPEGDGEVVMRFDVPSGQVEAHARVAGGRVEGVRFENVPAFAGALSETISVGGRKIRLDIGYGGAFYAIVPASEVGLSVEIEDIAAMRAQLREIRVAVEGMGLTEHPEDPRLSGLYGVIFTGPAHDARHHSRNLTVFADGQVDRSPCGSCVSARLAVLSAKGELEVLQRAPIESVIDTVFTGTILGPGPMVGGRETVRTAIEGEAYLVGFRRFFHDPGDEVGAFLIR